MALLCFALLCFALHGFVSLRIALLSIALPCFALLLLCMALLCIALLRFALLCFALHCIALHYFALLCMAQVMRGVAGLPHASQMAPKLSRLKYGIKARIDGSNLVKKHCLKAQNDFLLDALSRDANLSTNALANLLQQSSGKNVRRELDRRTALSTPYGDLICVLKLPPKEGSELVDWCFCNPFALLWLLCKRSSRWANFLRTHLRGKPHGGLVFYTDECTPGNSHHPSNPREFTGFYWTIAELPAWFRASKRGWLTFGFLPCGVLDQVQGGLASVCRHSFRHMFSTNSFDFRVGMHLPGHEPFRLKLNLLCFMQDTKAHKEVCSVKGAGGTVCCIQCKNVLNVDPAKVADSTYLHHYAHARPDQFDQHTAETFWAMADRLETAHMGPHFRGQKEALHALSQASGINFQPHGLLYDRHIRTFFCPVDNTYWDPMHLLLSSGGMCQYEVNGFTYHLVRVVGVSIAHLDEWTANIKWPKRGSTSPLMCLIDFAVVETVCLGGARSGMVKKQRGACGLVL
jgi:hypothetical protein